MAPSSIQLLIAVGVFAAITVFTSAFRFALRECADVRELACQPDIPRASILHSARHRSGARWMAGAHRQRALRSVTFLQAGFVAVGITSIFVMTLCMAGIVGLMIFG